MLERILRFSLERRIFVLGAAVVLLAVGTWRALSMPVDVFPDLTAPQVTIVTEATGLAPQEMERLVAFPIESAVNGVPGVRRVRSASAAGIAIVWVEFDWDTAADVARQRVTERLQSAIGTLPPEASAPTLAPPSSVMGEIAFIALTADGGEMSGMELRRIAEVEVRRRLLAVPGISQVVAIGGDERQVQVRVEPEALSRYGLTLEDVAAELERGSHNASGGFLVDRGQESVIRVLGRARRPEDLAEIPVALRDGTPVRVRDLGEVVIAPSVRRGTGSYRAQPAVVISIQKQPGADTLRTTELVDEALDAMSPDLRRRGIELHRDIFRQSAFIERSVSNLLTVLRDGAILVLVVLLVFLWSVRATIISVLAIPLSLLAAVLALEAFDFSLDTMTLGGLAIAIGELVDDAIVDVENVIRRLRERAALPEADRVPVLETVLSASREIRRSIVSATMVIVMVFTPLFFLEGLEGRLLRPLATSYVVAIAASLVVALTVTPALCLLLLPKARGGRAGTPPTMRAILRAYEPVLRWTLRWPLPVAAASVALIAASVIAFTLLGRSFLPEFNEGSLTIAVGTLPGTSLEQSDALGRMVEEALLADPAVVSTSRRTGRAERDEHVQSVEASEIEVMLREDPRGRDKEELLADIREALAAVPGVQVEIGQPISHRIDHMVSGQRAALTIKVIGEELQTLRNVAQEVRAAVDGTPGLVDLTVERIVDVPQTSIRIDAAAAGRFGLAPGEAADVIGGALYGRTVGHFYEEGVATEVIVRHQPERLDRETLERVAIATPAGPLVPLSTIAEVQDDRGPNYVMRENVSRRVVVTANVAGRDLRSVYEDVRRRIDRGVRPPEGVRIELAGQFEREQAARRRLFFLGGIAVLGIALVVGTTLRSTRRTLIVLLNLPLALAGGVVGVVLAGGVVSVASLIGFITLFGIATRNGIMLATHANDLEAEGVPYPEAVGRSARERLAPILMTAITAGLGLVPLALALGEPGSEIQAPMAIVILCGLASSTLLNMVVVPSLLARWGGSTPAPASPVAPVHA